MNETKQQTCADVVADRCRSRLEDIKAIMEYTGYPDDSHPDLGGFHEYGLCFDRVYPETFDDQPEGYWRWQLSYGGPSQEIRFYFDDSTDGHSCVPPARRCYRIEFWHLDWGDGASVDITDDATARRAWAWQSGMEDYCRE